MYYGPTEIKEKLESFVKKTGISIKELCIICDISRASYYKLISGKNVRIRPKTIENLKKADIL